jgi:hypothetical protein
MPAGNFTVFDKAIPKLSDGTIDLDSHAFKVCVTTNAQGLSTGFAGASTHCRYADLTAEAAPNGDYATGGRAITGPTWTQVGGVTTFDCDDANWTGCTMTVKYGVIYDDSTANKDLLGYVDLDTGSGSGIVVSAGDLTIMWNASGLFTVARAA